MKVQLISLPVKDPIYAHEVYVSKLGFLSKEFDADAKLAIVVAADQKNGPDVLLEPCAGTFAETYQNAAFEANLPIMIFSVVDVESEMRRLDSLGIRLRPELDRPDWGLTNLFEDGCGNLIMLQEESA